MSKLIHLLANPRARGLVGLALSGALLASGCGRGPDPGATPQGAMPQGRLPDSAMPPGAMPGASGGPPGFGGSGAFATGTSESGASDSGTSESETSESGTSGIRYRIGSRRQRQLNARVVNVDSKHATAIRP